ncbi:hypothetical protein EKO27_g9393 [Xylaria grammica]|uniref:AAA+ ATPase domain-containing protein n=1 Tax=Xylaria grammica TaxID=363999 RepID=A0A439CU49_9PEZI|nr:hypothetical protein EKO27_g9393 [Xylaria grammica]
MTEMAPNNSNVSSFSGALGLSRAVGDHRADHPKGNETTACEDADANAPPNTRDLEDSKKPWVEEEEFVHKILNHAVSSNGDEDFHATIKAAQDCAFEDLGRSAFTKEKDQGILARRTLQATIHTAFTDFRIQELETQLRQVRIDLYNLPEDFELHKRRVQYPVFRHFLRRSTRDKFEVTKESMNTPARDFPALEVLVTEQFTDLGTQVQLPTAYLAPKCLRIRPRPLVMYLQQVTQMNISNFVSIPGGNPEPNIVFLHPFKLLVTYEEEIRQSVEDLEKKLQGHISEEQNSRAPMDDANTTYDEEDVLLDLKLLVDFMDEDLKPTFNLRQKIKDGTATSIEYEDLWHLFQSGDIVLVGSDRSHAYRVLSFTGGREIRINQLPDSPDAPPGVDGFTIDCLSIIFNGFKYIPQLHTFSIRRYLGSRPITSLPVYPLRFDKDQESLKRDMTIQGRQYLDVTIPPQSHRHLRGRTLDEPPHDIDGQVIIDTSMALDRVPRWQPQTDDISRDQLTKIDRRETYLAPFCGHRGYHEGCCGSDVAFKDLDMDDTNVSHFLRRDQHMLSPREATDLEDEDLMLLPCSVHGFVLRNRQWVTLRVSDLSEPQFSNSFDDLMLPERHKSSIQALVQVHENAVTRTGKTFQAIGSSIDLVKGKGVGLILLLHGEPGVGKTSTAECVADHTKRPLFPITCGDIGETATEVEKNLHYNFRMAHKWGCVLLLDEADVFLAKRNKTDLRRNAVTSVFLRSLEYYAGILFLTTNRVGSIDPAFKSRIHISLFYPRFDLEATLGLYSTYIKRTRAEQESLQSATFRIKEKEILKFAKRHFRQAEKEGLGTWNGRQIRNAFQAAIALAEYDSQQTKEGDPRPTLGQAQFEIVADSSKEFDRYLVSTLGAADSDIARREEWRFDRFGNSEHKRTVMPQSHNRGQSGFYSRKYVEPDDDETSSDDDDDDDDDDDGSNDNGFVDTTIAQRYSRKKAQGMEEGNDKEKDEAEEFREFIKWKSAQKSGKGHQ